MSEELTNEQQWWAFVQEYAGKLGFDNRPHVDGSVVFFMKAVDQEQDLIRIERNKFIELLKEIVSNAPV